jgi:nucleoporin NUP82
MPSILARQPAWLDRDTPAFGFFNSRDHDEEEELERDAPCRKIVHRGTEIFAVVDNELRWSELGMLRDGSGSKQQPLYKVWP